MMRLIILFFCFFQFSSSQDLELAIGRGIDCFGRGACTIYSSDITEDGGRSNISPNSQIITNDKGDIVLIIYRDLLTKDEDERVLGEKITSTNRASLEFVIEEDIPVPKNVIVFKDTKKTKRMEFLKAGNYPTTITDDKISIIIHKNSK